MTRATGSSVQNNFIKGLITESTTLTFPEQAATDSDNVSYEIIGDVSRRVGMDFESGATAIAYPPTGTAVSTYLWRSVAGQGSINFVVSQLGDTLYFYRVTGAPLSSQRHAFTVNIASFAISPVTTVSTLECQYASGNGFLFVVNQNCDPFYVAYDPAGDTFSSTRLTLQIRDFKGLAEAGVLDKDRPNSLSDTHRYNLANQGWSSSFLGTSSTSNSIAVGSKTFTTQANLGLRAGDRVRIYSRATPGSLGSSVVGGNVMIGPVTSYSGTTLVVNVNGIIGTGTLTDWNIVQEPDYIEAWNILMANYPSNSDVWWLNLDTSNPPNFSPSSRGLSNLPGSAAANKGHFILNPFNEDRASVSGLSSLTAVSTGSERPTVVGFHAGRVWYGGVNYQGFNARLYFSQIVIDATLGAIQYANCYQQNDPTSQNFPELLADDGGVLDIIDCGVIYKIIPVLNSMVVFAANGTWAITGSQGTGFAANDFSVSKISSVYNTSGTSFVDVEGLPMWWNFEGIWTLTLDRQTNAMRVESLTFSTIQTYFNDIPLESISLARGAYDPQLKIIQWLFKSAPSSTFADKYVFDRILVYNTVTKSFSPWSFTTAINSTTYANINSIVNITGLSGAFTQSSVTSSAGANTVQSSSGADNVIVFTATSDQISFQFKYLCSTNSGGTPFFTFADMLSGSYLDWKAIDGVGKNYNSHFTTGFMTRGDAQRKWQTNYVMVWGNPILQSTFTVQGIDDYDRLSSAATVVDLINARPKRIKLRGHGLTKQFKISSVDGKPFDIIGWAVFQSSNKWI